jgi:hypothetical protein
MIMDSLIQIIECLFPYTYYFFFFFFFTQEVFLMTILYYNQDFLLTINYDLRKPRCILLNIPFFYLFFFFFFQGLSMTIEMVLHV